MCGGVRIVVVLYVGFVGVLGGFRYCLARGLLGVLALEANFRTLLELGFCVW